MLFFRFVVFATVFLHSQLLASVSLNFFKNKMTQSLARELEKEYRIPISWIQKQFKHLEMDTQTIELIQKPLEDKPWGTYQKLIIKPSRIESGKAFIEKEYKTLCHYEKIYRIPKEIVAAIIGIETNYGADKGKHTALSALATLAYYYPPRAQFFRRETKELLRLAYQGHWDLSHIKSSYAGALGIPQFMPSAMSQYAKGHSKHPHNLFNNTNDAIASVYHYLHKRGHWKPHPKIIEHFRPNSDQLAYLRTHKLDNLSFIPAEKLPADVFPRIGTLHRTQIDRTANLNVAYGIRTTTDGETRSYFIAYENFQSILSYNKSGHYAHAVTELANRLKTITSKPSTHAKNLDPKTIEPGLNLQKKGKFEQAICFYRTLLKSNPKEAVLYQLTGICYAQKENAWKECINYLKQATDLEPNNPHFLSSLANAYRQTGETAIAKMFFKKTLALEPNQLSALNNLGILYYNDGEIEEASKCFSKALANYPQFENAGINISLCYLKQQRYTEAKQYLERIVQNNPNCVKALFQLGQIHLQQGAQLQAQVAFEQVAHLDPKHAENHHQLGMVYLQLQQDDLALEHLEKAATLNPMQDDLQHNLASVYLHKRSYKKALKHWLTEQQHRPSSDTVYNIAVTYLYLGRYEESSDYFFQVLKDDPDHFQSLTNLGACYLQQNKRDLAKTYYQRAQAIQPTETAAFILQALGDYTQEYSEAPNDYIKDLFDHYAYHYDHHLEKVLHYQAPSLLKKLMDGYLTHQKQTLQILDLGCGTGLCGALFKPYSAYLKGIDLSENMLAHAKEKNIYDALLCARIPACLDDEPTNKYHLIIAADVLPYFGDLQAFFEKTARILHKSGQLAISVETSYQCTTFALQSSARYVHHPDYVKNTASLAKLQLLGVENAKLRVQQKQFVEGHVMVFCHTPT